MYVYLLFVLYTGKDIPAPNCIIIPLNPSFLLVDGGINNGTSNVMINCDCFNTGHQQIRWYSPDKEEILAEPEDLPYVTQEKGTLVIPIFNDSYQGTYYCRVGNDSVFAANISLTPWIGMFVCVFMCVCLCVHLCVCAYISVWVYLCMDARICMCTACINERCLEFMMLGGMH